MSLKSALSAAVTGYLTDQRRLARQRRTHDRALNPASPGRLDFFYDLTDPYSHLAALGLKALRQRYGVAVDVHMVGAPADWAAPERAKLTAYALQDASRLAHRAGLPFAPAPAQIAAQRLAAAEQRIAGALQAGPETLEAVCRIGAALWTGAALPDLPEGDAAAAKTAGEALRARMGHFMSGVYRFGAEWYWGLDRLHHLERRLRQAGLGPAAMQEALIFAPPQTPSANAGPSSTSKRDLHFYLSFRSPYTYLAVERVKALADAYGATLRLRFVLPMVMRGLPVPRMKTLAFTLDAAREAQALGIAFGRIVDPVGRPVERGYALMPWARDQGRDYDLCLAFMRAVWAHGVDAGTDAGLRAIVEAAGLDWREACAHLNATQWREEAEANRAELTGLGLWGVPCFRVGDVSVWGQDRLWLIEDALKGTGTPP